MAECLSTEEIKTYEYLLGKEGYDAALDYLNALEDHINQRRGMIDAYQWLQNRQDESSILSLIMTFFSGEDSGTSSNLTGIQNSLLADGTLTAEQYKQQYIVALLKQYYPSIYTTVYNAGTSLGNMIPMIMLNLTGTGFASALVAGAEMYAATWGNAYNETILQGYSPEASSEYAKRIALIETIGDMLLGTLPGVAVTKLSDYLGIDNMLVNELIDLLQEIGSENLQNILSGNTAETILGQEYNITLDEITETTLVSIILRLTMGGTSQVFNLMTPTGPIELTIQNEQLMELIENGNFNCDSYQETLIKNYEAQNNCSSITAAEIMLRTGCEKEIAEGIGKQVEERGGLKAWPFEIIELIAQNGGIENLSLEEANIIYENGGIENCPIDRAKIMNNYGLAYDVAKIIENISETSNITIQQALNKYSLDLLNEVRQQSGLSPLTSISDTLANIIAKFHQGGTTFSDDFVNNMASLSSTSLNTFESILQYINATDLVNPSATEIESYLNNITQLIESSPELKSIFTPIPGQTLAETINTVFAGAVGISKPATFKQTFMGLLSNYFYWTTPITTFEALENEVVARFGAEILNLIDKNGNVNEQLYQKYKGKLNNEEIRLLYNYGEYKLKEQIEQIEQISSITDPMEKARAAYNARNALRSKLQQLAIGENTLPGKGTNPWVTAGFNETFIYNGLTLLQNKNYETKIDGLLTNANLSTSAKAIITEIKNAPNKKELSKILKENYSSFTSTDLELIFNIFSSDTSISKVIANQLYKSAFKSNPGVNGSLGVDVKYKKEE